MRGEDGRASETRRCFAAACDDGEGGKGAVNENVDVNGGEDVEGMLLLMVVVEDGRGASS